MKKQHESKLYMYDSVIKYCDSRMDVINSMPALATSYGDFKRTVAGIRQTLQLVSQVITGFATDKTKLHDQLVQEAVVLASKIASYAKSINDNVMLEAVNFSSWKLDRLRDEELAPVCQNILLIANNVIGALAAYNVTPDDVARFDANIQAYVSWLAAPRNALAMRRKYVAQLHGLFKTADDILKDHLDKQVHEFEISNPDFYIPYRNNREVVDNGSTPTQIKGKVTNNSTDEPIEGVTITIMESKTSATSDDTGSYIFKPATSGTCTLQFEMEGFETKTVSGLLVKQGKVARVEVALSKAV